jgi:transposase-like protein
MIRRSKPQDRKFHRLDLVRAAQEIGLKPAARGFGTSPQTVRKWLRRFQAEPTLAALDDRSRTPHGCPHRISGELEAEIVRVRQRLPTYGAERLRVLFRLPCSEKAIRRVIRQNGLVKPRRTIRRKKNDLRAEKAKLALFERVHVDTKHLYDIAEYLADMKRKRLPRYQYTFRETVSGLQYIAFSQELAGVYAELFGERILAHLSTCGVEVSQTTVQTDNGSEFAADWKAKEPSGFTLAVESFGATHRTIPPGAHTWQSDVETVHNLIEDEFYRVERFRDREDFLKKAATYQLFFNVMRPNSSKAQKPPLEILRERWPEVPDAIALLPPVFLDDMLVARLSPLIGAGGNDLPSYPYSRDEF